MTATTAITGASATDAGPGLAPPASTSRTAPVVASALWVFVGGLLAYGIVQTAIKAAALFG